MRRPQPGRKGQQEGDAMPFVQIQILKGHPQARKDEIARRVVDAVSELAELPRDAVWVVFEDVEARDWYVGGRSVHDLKAGKKE
jgi:4-oxalocrotonate tautomerase